MYYPRNSSSNKRTENFFQLLVIVFFTVLVIFGAVSVVNAFKTHDGYSSVNLDYKVGEIVTDSTGTGVVSTNCKTALYSTKAVRCTGYFIETSFDTRVDYEIHYYTDDNLYVGYVSKSDITYHVDVGEMPVLKTYVGNLESQNYENAEAKLGDNGNEQVATYIRIVIRAINADDSIFDNWLTRVKFDNSLKIRATTRGSGDNTVASPSNPTESSSN